MSGREAMNCPIFTSNPPWRLMCASRWKDPASSSRLRHNAPTFGTTQVTAAQPR